MTENSTPGRDSKRWGGRCKPHTGAAGRHSGARAGNGPPSLHVTEKECAPVSGTNSGGTTDRLIRPEPFLARGVFFVFFWVRILPYPFVGEGLAPPARLSSELPLFRRQRQLYCSNSRVPGGDLLCPWRQSRQNAPGVRSGLAPPRPHFRGCPLGSLGSYRKGAGGSADCFLFYYRFR